MTKQTIKIRQLKKKLLNLGPMLPGSINTQWNVCGTPGCRCKDPKKPLKHGPYYQLSFNLAGKSSSFFIKKTDLTEAKLRIKRYQQFKKLCAELVITYVELTRQCGFTARRQK